MSPFKMKTLKVLGVMWVAISTTNINADTDSKVDTGATWIKHCKPDDAWDKAGPPFRIFGESYYVGTCGITAVLIVGDKGHVIIDGGPRDAGPLVAANVEALGYQMTDVKILLHTHEHFDHVGGLADLQWRSGASVIASKSAATVLESGIITENDPQAGMHAPFTPVSVSETIGDQETLTLGNLVLTAIATPGHTPGALSWTWRDCENENCKVLVYMDSLSPISSDSYRFSEHPEYLGRFKSALERISVVKCDIALTPHPAAGAMFERIASEVGLVDDQECRLYVEDMAKALERRLEREKKHIQETQ